ncbi:hypothetical protein PDIDSM_1610 [Penicillium digitatum]|nr:hypothetical protein PDIDSM_1610 [Penicillium digitatum]
MKWSDDRKKLVRWVSVDSEFLKGWRYRDDVKLPMNWFHEHPVLGLNLVFWVIVHGVADGAFKNLTSLDDVLAVRPPAHRTSFTLEWKEQCLQQPFFRMVTSNGPDPIKGLTFSSLRHHFTSLAERDGFRDKLRVHGIRGGVANRLDPKASQAARGQALDHQNPNTFLKYQAQLKTVDIQAAFCGFQPNIEGRDMQQSMEHHRDSNVPLRLNASRRIEFEADPEVIKMNEKIRALTQEIDGKPDRHPNLCKERSTLYGQKAKLRRSHQEKLVQEWWSSSYDEYISGNDFSEKDTTSLFDIYRKYIPERDRLSRNLFENTSIDSDIGRQCLADLIAICAPTERVVYYPGLHPVDGQCPLCSQAISRCRTVYLMMKPLV